MENISNEILNIAVSAAGAEMQSLKHLPSGRELLWQGDAKFWNRRSPILFPAVGGLWNGTCHVGDKDYALPKHGFMRDKTWTLKAQTAHSVSYEYVDKGEDRAAFPWHYVVGVTYEVDGRFVRAKFAVKNTGDETMYFQMGGHPGFALHDFEENAEVDGYVRLEGKPDHLLRAGEQGCTEPTAFPVPMTDDGLVPLCVETFANEALIFDAHQIERATLLDRQCRPVAAVKSTAPVWLFWSPQGVHAPFVCVEPWYGLCDPIGFAGDVSERPYINRLEPGTTWEGGYEIEVLL